jgi:hypothetical protein
MGFSGCRARRTDKSAFLLGLLAACGGCTTLQTPPASVNGAESPASAATLPQRSTFDAGIDLPAGQGRDILVSECLNCHELAVLELFKGFYTRDNWHALVVSMRANGAQVDDDEIDVLSAYLAQHFGAGAR